MHTRWAFNDRCTATRGDTHVSYTEEIRINPDIQDGLRHNPEGVIVIVEARVEEAMGND